MAEDRRSSVQTVSTILMPSEYERQAMEARRRRRMAELMAQQAYQPTQGGVAPIPAAAPLVQGLQAYLMARQLKKAEEAESKARTADIETAISEMQRINAPTQGVEFGDVVSMRPEDQERVKGLTGQVPVAGPEFNISPTGEVSGFQPMQMGEVPDLQFALPQMSQEQKRTAFAKMLAGGPVSQSLAAQGLAGLEKSQTEEFGTTPVKGAGGKYYLPSKSGRLVETNVEVPAEEMSPYEKEQIRLKEEELRINRDRGGADERPKAPSGYRYNEAGDLEAIPGGPQDPDRERPLPAQIAVLVTQEKNKAMRFGQTQNRTRQFIESIKNGELPLSKVSGAKYATQRAFDAARNEEGAPTEPYVKYYGLLRFVDQQVNAILSAAKGPQTEGDALRARQQILDNPDNEKVVLSALQDLDNLWSNEIDLANAAVEDYTSEYRSKKKDGVIDLPPRR